MAYSLGWPFAPRDQQAWLDILLVREHDDRQLEDTLRQAVPERALRVHTAHREDLEALRLPPMPILVGLAWGSGDDYLIARLRHRFDSAPLIAVLGNDDTPMGDRLRAAGANHCLTRGELASRLGADLVDRLFELHERDQALQQWRRRAEEANQRFASMIETMVDGQLIVDFSGTVRYANTAAHDMFGMDRGELEGSTFGSPVANDVAEIDLLRRSGEPIIVEMRVSDTMWEHAPMRLASLRDVTQRKRAEQEIQDSDRMSRAVLNAMADGLVIINDGGRIETFNKRAEEMFGLSAEDAVGADVSVLLPQRFAGESERVIAGYLRQGEARGIVEGGRELVGQRSDGSTFPMELAITRVWRHDWSGRGPNERLFIGLIRDITRRRHAQSAVLAAKSQAEMANRVKAEFLANMSQELRTPLNAIIGFAEMIRDLTAGPDDMGRYAGYGLDIYNSGQHLLDLINGILDMSKIESGRYELNEEQIRLPEAVAACLGHLGVRAQQGQVDLINDVPASLPTLWADPHAVRQILLNLIGNAVKFTPGGGSVRVAAAVESSGEIAVQISDTGIGMPRDFLDIVLAPFPRSDAGPPGDAPRLEGAGLGLTISRNFMELHGGALTIDSEVGAGTTVVARFPAERVRIG
jgi:PAS domain S-box-containing protein